MGMLGKLFSAFRGKGKQEESVAKPEVKQQEIISIPVAEDALPVVDLKAAAAPKGTNKSKANAGKKPAATPAVKAPAKQNNRTKALKK